MIFDSILDLCLLETTKANKKFYELYKFSDAQEVGYPFGIGPNEQTGSLEDCSVKFPLFAAGCSGSPLLMMGKCIGVGLSIDGIGKTYNYLRHPGNWDDVKENLLKYHEIPNVGFSYSHTIGWLNAWELPEFHTWTRENTPRFAIWNNIIHRPRHMSIVMIPKEAKQKIENKWRLFDWGRYKNDIDGIINFMYSEQPSDEEIAQAYQEFKRYDAVRNENILDIIPDELIQETKRYF